jgi:RNA polymerase sigma-70 factor (ECF subfamily)
VTATNPTALFEAERPRLVRIARQVLGNAADADDIVQLAWLRLDATETDIDNLPGWLTTVTTRLCLDRLRQRTPVPQADVELTDIVPDPAEQVALADTVAVALQVVLERLSPNERIAFVLHDSFAVDFPTIAEIIGTTPVAARKLASRARAKVTQPAAEDRQADARLVDAFLDAARNGNFERLMQLLAPDAVLAGTPARIEGRREVATMFNGAAKAALPVFIGERPGAAWFHRGDVRVAFDFTILDGVIARIDLRAAPDVLSAVQRRRDDSRSDAQGRTTE